MMIVLALFLVASPIIAMLYFAIYKSYMYFHKKKIPNIPIASTLQNPTIAVSSQIYTDKDDEEMTAVITAAINMYLNNEE